MKTFSFLLLLLPLFLIGQEQVSDIHSRGIFRATDVTEDIGFAEYDGIHYMLQENDSLAIYKWENDSFQFFKSVKETSCVQRAFNIEVDPNRSLFEIRGSTYYRFLGTGIQLIDIEKGELIKTIDWKDYGVSFYRPNIIVENRMYLETYIDDSYYDAILYTDTRALDTTDVNLGHALSVQASDLILGVTPERSISLYNAHTKFDTILYTSSQAIISTSFSAQDSSFVFIQEDGTIWKVFMDYSIVNLSCKLSSTSAVDDYVVHGNKLIEVTEDDLLDNTYVISVRDLETCLIDVRYTTSQMEDPSYRINHIISENNNEEFSIVGLLFPGYIDGPVMSQHYIINHEQKSVSPLPIDEGVLLDHTPVLVEDDVFMTGRISFFGGFNDYILKHNLGTSSTDVLMPADIEYLNSATLGFSVDDGIIIATNEYNQNPLVWNFDQQDSFNEVMPLNFLGNVGIVELLETKVVDDRIYFTTAGGVFSVRNETDKEIDLMNVDGSSLVVNSFDFDIVKSAMLLYEDKLIVADIYQDKTIFKRLDINTGEVDSLVSEDIISSYSGTIALGPMLFYNESTDEKIHYLDVRTMTIGVEEDARRISTVHDIAKGENSAVQVISKAGNGNWDGYLAYHIDYNTAQFTLLDMELDNAIEVIAGYDNSFYVGDKINGTDSTRIRLVKNTGEISTIYEGRGYIYDRDEIRNSALYPYTIIHVSSYDDESFLITTDSERTSLIEFYNKNNRSNNSFISDYAAGGYILHTRDSIGSNFWYYEAFETPVEIETNVQEQYIFTDYVDGKAVICLRQSDGNLRLITYDVPSEQKQSLDDIPFDCNFSSYSRKFYFGNNKFIINAYCDLGSEPYILDIANGSIELIGDVYPGVGSSSPSSFIKLGEWVYFTANTKHDSRQWFRWKEGWSNTVELVQEDNRVVIYPNPATDQISFDQDLSNLEIYNVNGQRLMHKKKCFRNQSLDVSSLESGMYLISARDKSLKFISIQFVKE